VDATVTQLADRLLASYAAVGGINHVDGPNLPSKSAIAAISHDLLRLVFPGFFDDRPLVSSELKVETTLLLASVLERLEDEIRKSLEYAPPSGMTRPQIGRAAHQGTLDFLAKMPCLRELLQTDADAAYRGDPAALSKEEVIVAYPFMEAIAIQRMAHELSGYNSKIEGDVIVTRVDAALNWFRKNSLWPMPMGLACCAIELMAAGASRFDISRFRHGGHAVFAPSIGRDDRGGHGDLQDGAGGEAHLRADGRAEVGDRHGRVRLDGRHVSQLRGAAGRGQHHSGGRLRGRLSAASGGVAGRADQAAEARCQRRAGLKKDSAI
jgi:hypothetical protein